MGNAYTSPLKRWDICSGLLKEMDGKTFVEVGVKEGRLSAAVLKNLPATNVIAIDPWAPVPNSHEDYSGWDFADIERQFWDNVGEHKERVEMMRDTSLIAASILDGWVHSGGLSIDMVFIDASHDYANVIADIKAWWPLVRKGGILAGHDFNHKWPDVMRAVADSFPLMRVSVFPDSVWAVEKAPDIALKVAA